MSGKRISNKEKTILNFDDEKIPYHEKMREIAKKIRTPPNKKHQYGIPGYLPIYVPSSSSGGSPSTSNNGFSGFGGDPSRNLGGY